MLFQKYLDGLWIHNIASLFIYDIKSLFNVKLVLIFEFDFSDCLEEKIFQKNEK